MCIDCLLWKIGHWTRIPLPWTHREDLWFRNFYYRGILVVIYLMVMKAFQLLYDKPDENCEELWGEGNPSVIICWGEVFVLEDRLDVDLHASTTFSSGKMEFIHLTTHWRFHNISIFSLMRRSVFFLSIDFHRCHFYGLLRRFLSRRSVQVPPSLFPIRMFSSFCHVCEWQINTSSLRWHCSWHSSTLNSLLHYKR